MLTDATINRLNERRQADHADSLEQYRRFVRMSEVPESQDAALLSLLGRLGKTIDDFANDAAAWIQFVAKRDTVRPESEIEDMSRAATQRLQEAEERFTVAAKALEAVSNARRQAVLDLNVRNNNEARRRACEQFLVDNADAVIPSDLPWLAK